MIQVYNQFLITITLLSQLNFVGKLMLESKPFGSTMRSCQNKLFLLFGKKLQKKKSILKQMEKIHLTSQQNLLFYK